MEPKLRIIVFHDVLCTWCYIANKNLKKAIEPFYDAIELVYVSWLLYPHDFESAGERAKESILKHWEDTRTHPEGAEIDPDAIRQKKFTFPYSIPALAAIKCAEKQGGPQMHQKFYDALQEGLYIRGENVNDIDVFKKYAEEFGLDVPRFISDYRSGIYHELVVKEFEQSRNAGIEAIPATIIGHELIFGAVPVEEFKESIERQLRGESRKAA